MDYTTWTITTRTEPEPALVPSTTLYQTLQALSDPRRKQGKRYELAVILSLLVLAKLAGKRP
ncbi:hypothetical protein [Dictyobacter formicarum]|uniref:H repeat-associated protein N-terminal domain-containing protein n=1 Tax=Dictyobacter formicarum TaxID=2778368 RepID=A0ABQ3VWE7_9CHLR|nr:hypothetical protein [Dictyobacter formicarum]GHO89949.1 hypothetical protein KSZ_79550 [Dictyobacter formicarum]